MRKAIILNSQQTGLSVIQELGRHNIECVAMDYQRSIGTYSKYAVFLKAPDPLSHEQDAVEFLFEYCAKEKIKPVLFPISDEWVTALAQNRGKISSVALPCVSGWETVRTVVQKEQFYRLAQERGYMTPYMWELEELPQLQANNFPLVAKPRFRRFSYNTEMRPLLKNMERLRCCTLRSRQDLETFLTRESAFLKHLIFQEYVEGLSDCMFTVGIYADQNSKVLGLFTGHKVRGHPVDIGNCIVGENYAVPAELVANMYRIVSELNIQGIAEFEYKKDSRTGSYRLIEVNLRAWSWIGITPACGVSLPMIAYRDLCGNPVEFTESTLPNGSVKYVKVLEDAKNSLFRYKTTYPAWGKSVREWMRDIHAEKTVYAEFNAYDWIVGLKSLFDAVWKPAKALIGRLFA